MFFFSVILLFFFLYLVLRWIEQVIFYLNIEFNLIPMVIFALFLFEGLFTPHCIF